nr:TOBE domain-containing protein [Marinicella sp. W31]MDC2876278.1 TOBE domain-containing protein [Marinicella sp. W31]
MNLIEGTVEEQDGTLVLRSKGGALWSLPALPALPAGAAITIGVRPEHVSFSESGTEAVIEFTETTGSETHATMTAGGDQVLLLTPERVPYERHQKVKIAFETERLHVFDTESGARLN